MLQRMRVLEEAGMRFTEKPVAALSTMGGDGGFLHAAQTSSGTVLELVLDGFLHPKEARRCGFRHTTLLLGRPSRPPIVYVPSTNLSSNTCNNAITCLHARGVAHDEPWRLIAADRASLQDIFRCVCLQHGKLAVLDSAKASAVLSRRAMHGGERLRSVVHRVAIFNKEGTITDIVSQSDVVRCASWAVRMPRAQYPSSSEQYPD